MSKLRITPIGTCRIHTPLRRATLRYPVEADLRRNYGFVHTSEEALQLLRFLQGEKSFQPDVSPLVFRDADPAQFAAQSWAPSDLHIVEISSAKLLRCGDDFVQSNYVQRHFADFFASSDRARTFWGLVRKGHRQELVEYLSSQPTYRMLSAEDRVLLRSLSMEQQSFKSIKAGMEEIVQRLGADKLLFVTHVNALLPDGERIPSRDRVIRWVKLAATQLEVPVIDPTPLMEEIGQEQAMEDNGRDLTHFSLTFSDRFFDLIFQQRLATKASIAGKVSAQATEDQKLATLAAGLETSLEEGDFFAASKQVHSELRKAPDALPLIHLRGLIRSRIGDYQGALEDLNRRDDSAMFSANIRLALLETLMQTGDYQTALQMAQQLIAEEFESPPIYRAAAKAAEEVGNLEQAVQYLKQTFRRDRGNVAAALHALVLLGRLDLEQEGKEWRRELLDNLGSGSNGSFALATWAIEQKDAAMFGAALKNLALEDKGATIDLVEDAANAEMHDATARAIPLLPQLGRLPKALAARRNAILNLAVDQMRELLEQEKPIEAHRLAQALAQVPDHPNSQIMADRLEVRAKQILAKSERQVRLAVRVAFRENDPERVLSIAEGAEELLVRDPDTAVIVGRALESLGRQTEALALLQTAQAANPEHVGVTRWTGRIAASIQEYAPALDMYGRLRTLDSQGTFAAEVERFFASIERRALKQLRYLVETGQNEQALTLATAITTHLGPMERVDREKSRMYRLLRIDLMDLEQNDGDARERETVLRKLLQIKPDDKGMLRRLALILMSQFRFAEAADIWTILLDIDPDNESADRNRVRCATLAERRALETGTELAPAG